LSKKEKIITLLHELLHFHEDPLLEKRMKRLNCTNEKSIENKAQKLYAKLTKKQIKEFENLLKNRVRYRIK